MHPTDGNTYALEKHLAEQEAYDAAQPVSMYCGSCDEIINGDDWPEFIDTETCGIMEQTHQIRLLSNRIR